MKESIGGTQIMILVIFLVLIFAGLMSFTINHSNAFAIKDQMVSVIEKYGGFDTRSEITPWGGSSSSGPLQEIVDLIEYSSYRQTGRCPSATGNSTVAAYQRNGTPVSGNDKASFCIVRISSEGKNGAVNSYYYQVIVFYNLDVPALKSFFSFKAVGETKVLYS